MKQASEDIAAVLTSRKRPIVLTLRPAEFGGARDITLPDRIFHRLKAGWINSEWAADFWDVEFDLAQAFQQQEKEGNDLLQLGACDWTRTICSYHDFAGVPSDLEQIYQRMAATPARIVKMAVRAGDVTDCLLIFYLLERARRERRKLIAIAMGQPGVMTRILGPSRGSYLTYGSLDDESATAPGQLTARELREFIESIASIRRPRLRAYSASPSPTRFRRTFTTPLLLRLIGMRSSSLLKYLMSMLLCGAWSR